MYMVKNNLLVLVPEKSVAPAWPKLYNDIDIVTIFDIGALHYLV